ncbi:hypothetical protein ACRAWG_15125 [Methylobacterium sp. P31]
MPQRRICWSAALRDLKADRATRHPVREERLRSTAGLRGSPALPLTAWRGRSGNRYVCGVYQLTADALDDAGACVVIAARRVDIGTAVIVDVAAFESDATGLALFLHGARMGGANELHLHRLAEIAAERAAIVADLN